MPPGLTLLLTSPRVAPGLLTYAAWQALAGADLVLCADQPHDLEPALVEAAIPFRHTEFPQPRERARELVEAAQSGSVLWLGSADGDPGLTDALADELSRVALGQDPPPVEVLVGSHDVPGARLLDLVAVMDRLRSPGGCPWDAAQTHDSLAAYLIEEAYELVEAIESGERAALEEELGDVLLQVAFHARLAQEDEQAPFDIDDVAAGIVAKLVRRHPHVFAPAAPGEPAAAEVRTAAHVEANWDRIKAEEKGRESVLDGIPTALPALARADALLGRLQRAGIEPGIEPATAFGPAGERVGWDAEAVGETLLDVVHQARAAGVDAEAALRGAVRRLEGRARAAERVALPGEPAGARGSR